MGSFRLDPFQSYPVQATAVVNQTVDYCELQVIYCSRNR